MDKLSLCQTLTAGRLLEAAKIKDDETALPQIEGKDLVAIEVRYHQSKKYVNFLTLPARQSPTVLSHYNRAYRVFCDEVVKKRLLQKKEMMMMIKLRQKFAKHVKAVERVQCSSSYRTSNLKARLKNSFPQLVFQPAQSRSKSDIVYCETIGVGDLAENAIDSETDTDTDTTTVALMMLKPTHKRDHRVLKMLVCTQCIVPLQS